MYVLIVLSSFLRYAWLLALVPWWFIGFWFIKTKFHLIHDLNPHICVK